MTFPLFLLSSVESLRCHADDEDVDPEVVPSDSTLHTLVYVSSLMQVMLCQNKSCM